MLIMALWSFEKVIVLARSRVVVPGGLIIGSKHVGWLRDVGLTLGVRLRG